MLDLRSGKVCKTLIPKVAEGIFDVLAVFNATVKEFFPFEFTCQ